MFKPIAYLTLQATCEGQAAHAHVHEIVAGLRQLGWQVDLYEPSYSTTSPTVGARLMEFSRLQRQVALNLDRYSAVYVRSHPLALPLARAAQRRGLPVVQECNGPYQDAFTAWPKMAPLRPLVESWQREQYRNASAIITVSSGLAAWLSRQAPLAEVTVIPNGANVDLFRPDAQPMGGLCPPYAVFFGALASWQGIDIMLDAAGSPEWPDTVGLVIAGEGACSRIVERAAIDNNRISYLGTVPYRQVPGLVTGSIVGLSVQSTQPGRPLPSAVKVYETLACGRPIVVTESSGGASFVTRHQCGTVIAPDDPRALARAVRDIYSEPRAAERMGARGRNAVVAEASWKARATEVSEVLQFAMLQTTVTAAPDHPQE